MEEIIVKEVGIIQTKEQADEAVELRNKLKALKSEIEASYKPIIEQAYRAHKEAISKMNEHLKPVEEALAKVNNALALYQKRVEDEARAKALAEMEKQKREEEERNLRLAETLSKLGLQEEAEKMISKEVVVSVEIDKPKLAGVSFMEVWDFEITDEKAIPREYLTPDTKKIGQVVRATKGTLEISGIRIYSRKVAR